MPTGVELLNKITSIRREQASLTRFLWNRDELLGTKLFGCGTWLHMREWTDHGGETRLVNANFCKKHLVCMACAARRSVRLVEAYAAKVATVLDDARKEGRELIPAMVTLTVKNGPELGERIAHCKRAWSSMLAAKRRGASESGRHVAVQWNRVAGSVRALEITKNRNTREWHPHMHCFVLLESYLDQAELSREWEHWTGDSKIVGVTKCRNKQTGEVDALAGLFEVVKYAVKFSEMSHEDLWHVYQTCGGTRSVDPQGSLRGVPEPDIDADSIQGLSGPTVDYIARWLFLQEKYELEKWEGESVNKFGFSPRAERTHIAA